MDELELTEEQAGELQLPQHDRWNGDAIVWGAQSQTANLKCSVCRNIVPHTLSVPAGVAVSENISFTCKECNSSNGRRKRTIAAKPAKRRGRPPKPRPLNGQAEPRPESGQVEMEESVLVGALSAGLAGFSPVLPKEGFGSLTARVS